MKQPSSLSVVLRPREVDETFDLALLFLQKNGRRFLFPWLIWCAVILTSSILVFALLDAAAGIAVLVALTGLMDRWFTLYLGRYIFQAPTSAKVVSVLGLRALPTMLTPLAIGALMIALVAFPDDSNLGPLLSLLAFTVFCGSAPHFFEIVLLEQLPLTTALRRAHALVSRRVGRNFALLSHILTVRLLYGITFWSVSVFVMGFVLQFENAEELLSFWPALVGCVVASPHIAMARLLDYVDVRTRREGWDIQVLFHRLRARYTEEGSLP